MQLNLDPGVENRIFVYCSRNIAKVRHGQKDELGGLPPELALLTVPNFREYFYTKIRLPTPALSALLLLAGTICLS